MINKSIYSTGSMGLFVIMGLNSILIGPALAQSGGYRNWRMGHWMMGDLGMGWFGMILMLVFWVLVITGIVFFIRWLVQNTGNRSISDGNADSQAIEILKGRYANGEITRDEFESMKRDILR
jgi:putative membrane protein